MAVYDSVLDLIGNTPIVDVIDAQPEPRRADPRQAGGPEPGRVGEGPHRQADDPRRREGRHPDAGLGQADPRVVVGQHRHRPGDDRSKMRGYPSRSSCPTTCRSSAASCSRSWGAEIIVTPGAEGSNGAMRRAQALADEHPEWWFPFQYGNAANPQGALRGHRARDLARRARRSPTSSPASARAGTLMGVGRFLKEQNPDVQIWAIEPPRASWSTACSNLDEGFIPPVFDNGRLRPARPQAHRAAPRVDRVDPPPHRGRASSPASPPARSSPAR